jgi:riboflavin biosynthesis pyrimidine reductase
MNTLAPLETLLDTSAGLALQMPPELAMIYGRLAFPKEFGRTYVISNFVATLDGIVSLNASGHTGGGEISGNNQQDRLVMGLLRAAAAAVIVGAGTLRSARKHIWTPAFIFPPLADGYRSMRAMLNKPELPLNVIVTRHGQVDPGAKVFNSELPVLVVTNERGQEEIKKRPLPAGVQMQVVGEADTPLSAKVILEAVNRVRKADLALVEGGPHLLGDFVAERRLDEQFLTLAPQMAGRNESTRRLGLVEGKLLAPERPVWSRLLSVKRTDDFLFLRYCFDV